MSKTEALRQMVEGDTPRQLSEVAQLLEEIHARKVQSAEELAQSLEPLLSVMLKITSDTVQALEALRQSSSYIKTQHEESIKTWNYFLSKTGEQAGKIQNTQSLTANAAQEMRTHTAEMAKQANNISKMQTWAHWGYPLALAVLVSLLWTGFALWRMPDFDILFDNQKKIYNLLKKVEEKAPVPVQGGKK